MMLTHPVLLARSFERQTEENDSRSEVTFLRPKCNWVIPAKIVRMGIRCLIRAALGHRSTGLSVVLCLAAVALAFAEEIVDVSALPAPVNRKIDFIADVQPLFATHCLSCHGPQKQKSDYRLDQKSSALTGGSIGGAIVVGKSGQSKLIHYVAGLDKAMTMPPRKKTLTDDEIAILRAWIDQGANWPASADVNGEATPLWSLAPLAKPGVPTVRQSVVKRTSIDAFIIAKLDENGLTPAPPAEPRALVRRIHFDLIGLPPTPEEVNAFVEAAERDRQAAIESLVDNLLASPRYGERWARHWMDVVHFAETHGHDQDRPRPTAWPYRDYLIRAFNEDKPYTRFIEDQIAGDVLHANDPWATAALGMLAAGPWDESSQMGIQDGTVDKKVAQYLDRDDMIATTISSFNSVTIHCARCHNHKFDPISIDDYYALQAVFAGVDRANRSYEPDEKVRRVRSELQAEKAKLDANTLSSEELLSARNVATIAEWERAAASAHSSWTVVDPAAFTSAHGATLTKQPDGSLLSGGTRPEKDSYTITTSTKLKNITAIRLEVLTDDSLPHKGPGRQDNGNLHLSEFRVDMKSGEAKPISLKIRAASADWNQEGWGITRAIDGNAATAWGIYPNVGQPHVAIFELENPVNAEGGDITLTFTLDQLHGGGHLIGRPRLSITDAATPASAAPLPQAIETILRTAPDQRSPDQKKALALHVIRERNSLEIAKLPPPPLVYAATSGFPVDGNFKPAGKPREVFVLKRGDILQPGSAAVPGSLSCVNGPEPRFKLSSSDDEGARRAALARWVSHRDNVLTWRSIVNRVWHYHFGRGIVDTPNDLGRMGGSPSHPELLDWLAVTFRDDMQGSLKKLHKLIITSRVYQQSTQHNEKFASIDGDNRLLWRMNRLRLDAEQTRDSMLAISGKLDLTMYGPSVKQFIEKPGVHVTPVVDYEGFDVDHPNQFRRSVYRFVFRTLPDPLMDALDCPDLSQLSPKRNVSVTAQQALEMLNNRFMVRQCEHIATRIERERPVGIERQIQLASSLILGRESTADEVTAIAGYVKKHGLANAVRVLINSNEFMFLN